VAVEVDGEDGLYTTADRRPLFTTADGRPLFMTADGRPPTAVHDR
jgi:hypothetical protein